MTKWVRRRSVVAFFILLVVILAVPTTTLANSEPITSFRMRMVVEVSGDAFDTLEFTGAGVTGMTIEAAFTEVPPAAQMMFKVDENLGMANELQMIQIDGTTYINLDGEWIESPTEEFGDINELFAAMEIEDTTSTEGLEFIGNEIVNGRPSLHYRGAKERLDALNVAGVDPNVIGVFNEDMTLQMDVWLDEARQIVTKVIVVIEGPGMNEALPDAIGRVEATVELYDLNGDIVITAPVTGDVSAPKPVLINEPTPEPEPQPAPDTTPEPTPEVISTPELAPQPAAAPQAPAEVGPLTNSIWSKVKK